MFTKLFGSDRTFSEGSPREGELYKVVTVFGRTFSLRYGYYEECDRQSPLCEPVIIYPDFLREPLYTEDGTPFVTMMQDACQGFLGASERTEDSTCAECAHFKKGEEWFGLCTCSTNRRPDTANPNEASRFEQPTKEDIK